MSIYGFYTSKGYKMSKDTFKSALARVEVDPGFPADLDRYLHRPRRDPAQGEEDQGDPGLEQGAAPGIHAEGARDGVSTVELRASGPR